MGLIGIRYGKVVHRPSCPAWARIACVLRAARTSPKRIAAARDHRFMVLCFALSMSILSSSRRVIPALRAPTRHGLKLWEKLRRTKYTPHGHPASLLLIRTMPRVAPFFWFAIRAYQTAERSKDFDTQFHYLRQASPKC